MALDDFNYRSEKNEIMTKSDIDELIFGLEGKIEALQGDPISIETLLKSISFEMLNSGIQDMIELNNRILRVQDAEKNPENLVVDHKLGTYDPKNPYIDLLYQKIFRSQEFDYEDLTDKEKQYIGLSKRKPGKSANKNAVYYTAAYYDNKKLLTYVSNHLQFMSPRIEEEYIIDSDQLKKMFIDGESVVINVDNFIAKKELLYKNQQNDEDEDLNINGPLRNVTFGRGKDQYGYYISYYDIYDFDPFKQLVLGLNSLPKFLSFFYEEPKNVEDIVELCKIINNGKGFEFKEKLLLKLIPNKIDGMLSEHQIERIKMETKNGGIDVKELSSVGILIKTLSSFTEKDIKLFQRIVDLSNPFEIYDRMYYKANENGIPVDENGESIFDTDRKTVGEIQYFDPS